MTGPSMPASASRKRVGTHPALVVGGGHPDPLALAPEPEHLERGVDRDMGPAVGDDGHGRRSLEAMTLHVPARPGEDGAACRGERREVGHRRAGHEPDARPGREAEQLDQPAARDLLGDRRSRRDHVQAGVLVPRAGQPVRRERRRQAATDDEPEVASPGARDEARVGRCGELLDHRERVRRGLGERTAHRRSQRREIDRTTDGAGRERRQVVGRDGGRPGQESDVVGHGLALLACRNGWDARPFDRLMLP